MLRIILGTSVMSLCRPLPVSMWMRNVHPSSKLFAVSLAVFYEDTRYRRIQTKR